jgi:hypothetical protein
MTKKLIAREFLISLSSLIFSGLIFMILFFIDNYYESKSNELNNKATQMEHFEPYSSLIQYTKEAKRLNYDYDKLNILFPQFAGFDRQALKDYCATVEERDYNFVELNSKFPEFGFDKDGSHPNFNLTAYKELKKDIISINSRTPYSTGRVFTKLLIAIFSLTFLLRYLIYAAIWSVKQLRKE